jgi:hypothetical protein
MIVALSIIISTFIIILINIILINIMNYSETEYIKFDKNAYIKDDLTYLSFSPSYEENQVQRISKPNKILKLLYKGSRKININQQTVNRKSTNR